MKFPKLHIAESVVNRIMNASDEIMAGRAAMLSLPDFEAPPAVPDPTAQGAAVTLGLEQINPEGTTTPGAAEVAVGAALGQTPLDALLGGS